MKVVILCGGPSSEYDVSLSTTEGIIKNIDKKYEISVLLMSKDYKTVLFKPTEANRKSFPTPQNDLADDLKEIKPGSVVLNAMHGEFGEDGVVQSLLETKGLKYTGSKVLGSVLCMDKYASYQVINGKVDVIVPEIYAIGKILSVDISKLKFPLVVKPNALGSSVGVEIVDKAEDLKNVINILSRYYSGLDYIFQEYISDSVEISCGCLESASGEFIELPPIEIIPQVNRFYNYNAKYDKGGSDHKIPPVSIAKRLQGKISKMACEIHRILGCSGYSRSDFLVKDDKIYFLETNSLPGMTATSLIPEGAKAIGMSYSQFLDFIIENA